MEHKIEMHLKTESLRIYDVSDIYRYMMYSSRTVQLCTVVSTVLGLWTNFLAPMILKNDDNDDTWW
jgi:hypothetical protein